MIKIKAMVVSLPKDFYITAVKSSLLSRLDLVLE